MTLSTTQADKQRARAPAGLAEQGLVSQFPALTVIARRQYRDGFLTDESTFSLANAERIFLAPSLTWRPSTRTQIDLDFMYQDEDALRQSAIGNRQSAIGNRQSAIGNRQSAIGAGRPPSPEI